MKNRLLSLSIAVFLLSTHPISAQTLHTYLIQFAQAGLQEKAAIHMQPVNYDQQAEQLQASLRQFSQIPMRYESKIMRLSNTCDLSWDGHIKFLPAFVSDYIEHLPDEFSTDIPYVDNEGMRDASQRVTFTGIYYANMLVCPKAIEQINYPVLAGEQQMIVLAEDDTPLEVTIRSEAGTALTCATDPAVGYAHCIWQEAQQSRVYIEVKNPSDKPVSFAIAIR